jgi:hypothetical protein
MLTGPKSAWEFKTSNSGGLGVGVVAAEGGSVTLVDPNSGRLVKAYYGSVGAGISLGVKLPKLGRGHLPGMSGSSEELPSHGSVYLSRSFGGKDLVLTDFNGACCFLELAFGLVWGNARYAMTFGMNPAALVAGTLNGHAMSYALETAKGHLVFDGWSFGLQAGAGVTGFMGMITAVPQ